MQVPQFFCQGKKRLDCFAKAILFIAIIFPFKGYSQEAGCFDADTLYVKINTVPAPVNASPANFSGCSGSYTYQWQVSTDDKYFTDVPGATGEDLNYNQTVGATLFFLRKATCGGITKYTNSVVVYPVYTACADFGLSLSGTSGNALATIKAGLLTTTTNSTIGEFVIEWYKDVIDDTPEFVSGSVGATDPEVTVTHPFPAEPAEGGLWHPVIRYVYIDGIKYSRKYMSGARHSPDLLHCLDPIVVLVNNLNCANGGSYTASTYFAPGTYAHKITYTNGLNSATLAARSFKFDLDSMNKYFAWMFTGYQEADKMKITYVSPSNNTSTVLESWEVGQTAGTWDITTSPKKITFPFIYKITSLMPFTFSTGDYLLIEITPSANVNTNWEFLCKCLTAIDCNIWDGSQRNIAPGSVTMVYNSANSSYDVSYNKSATPYTDESNSTLLKYNLRVRRAISSGYQNGNEYDNKVTLQLVNKTNGGSIVTSDYSSCNVMSSPATVNKTGSTLTVVFSSAADYNQYKNNYSSILSSSNMSNYDPDATKLNHYKFFIIRVRVANSCGDSGSDYFYYTHYTNPPTFDDATMTMTWNFTTITNNYVAFGPSDFTGQTIQTWVDQCNSSVTSANVSTTNTNIRSGAGFAGLYVSQFTTNETQKTFRYYVTFPSVDVNVCDLSTKGFTNQGLPSDQWEYSYFYDRVTITNTADPINNFKLERLMDSNGISITNPANYITIYEIVNGVVTVNRGFPN